MYQGNATLGAGDFFRTRNFKIPFTLIMIDVQTEAIDFNKIFVPTIFLYPKDKTEPKKIWRYDLINPGKEKTQGNIPEQDILECLQLDSLQKLTLKNNSYILNEDQKAKLSKSIRYLEKGHEKIKKRVYLKYASDGTKQFKTLEKRLESAGAQSKKILLVKPIESEDTTNTFDPNTFKTSDCIKKVLQIPEGDEIFKNQVAAEIQVLRKIYGSQIEIFEYTKYHTKCIEILIPRAQGKKLTEILTQFEARELELEKTPEQKLKQKLDIVYQRLHLALQLCLNLELIHQENIIHRDLKPDNIIVHINPDDLTDITVNIIDYGSAKESGRTLTDYDSFTQMYAPPEIVRKTTKVANEAHDVYSLTLCLIAIICGLSQDGTRDLFTALNIVTSKSKDNKQICNIAIKLLQEKIDKKGPFWKNTYDFIEILANGLNPNPKDRSTFVAIKTAITNILKILYPKTGNVVLHQTLFTPWKPHDIAPSTIPSIAVETSKPAAIEESKPVTPEEHFSFNATRLLWY